MADNPEIEMTGSPCIQQERLTFPDCVKGAPPNHRLRRLGGQIAPKFHSRLPQEHQCWEESQEEQKIFCVSLCYALLLIELLVTGITQNRE